MSENNPHLLRAEGLHVRHGGRSVLQGVDVELRAGEVGAILGPNGAGKSTLLGVLGGLQRADAGRVRLNDQPLDTTTAASFARHRAYLPQDLVPAFDFTAQEVVELGRYPHRLQPEPDEAAIVRAAMQCVSVDALARRGIRQLSGGERARVQIARVMAQVWRPSPDGRPRWLLLDEPTAALDLRHQHQCLSALRDWSRAQGIGVLMVLHDLNLALRYADRVWVLAHGQLVAQGATADALTAALVRTVWRVNAHPVRDPAGVPQFVTTP